MLKQITIFLLSFISLSAIAQIDSNKTTIDSLNILKQINDIKTDSIINGDYKKAVNSLDSISKIEKDTLQKQINTTEQEINKKDTLLEQINTSIVEISKKDTLDKKHIDIINLKINQKPEKIQNTLKLDTIFSKRRKRFSNITNTGERFLLREIEYEYLNSDSLNDTLKSAIGNLLEYRKNDTIVKMVRYLKEYLKTQKTEKALRQISINTKNTFLDSTENNFNNKLEILRKQIDQDSTMRWLREIDRDSVNLSIKNMLGDSLNFWINNGKYDYKRFWLKKSKKDSIGVWVQNNKGNSLKLFVDDDVYQASVTKQKHSGAKVRLNKIIDPDIYKLAQITKKERYKQIWKYGAEIGLGFNQGHVANWTRGGESSISTLATLEAFARYTKGKSKWENELKIKYGLLKSGSESLRKNEDRIEFNSKYGQKAFKSWYYSAMVNTQSQIAKGYNYPDEGEKELNSKFMGPAYFLASLGMDYKPKKDFSILLSPLTGKWTYVSDTTLVDQTQYGVDKNKKVKSESGAYFKLLHTATLSKDKNIIIKNIFQAYSAYSNEPKNVDLEWEFSIFLPINQYMTTSISTHIISDKDTHKKVQFKEAISIGIRYKL